MIEKEWAKKLIKHLNKVNIRLQILDMVEDKLIYGLFLKKYYMRVKFWSIYFM